MAVLRENDLANGRPPTPSLTTTLGGITAAACSRCRSRHDLRIRHGQPPPRAPCQMPIPTHRNISELSFPKISSGRVSHRRENHRMIADDVRAPAFARMFGVDLFKPQRRLEVENPRPHRRCVTKLSAVTSP